MIKRLSNSIFIRYFLLITSILFICVVTLGTVVISSFSSYWLNERQEIITETATSISELITTRGYIQKTYSADGTVVRYRLTSTIGAALAISSQSIDADIFITNPFGRTEICSEGINCIHSHAEISSEIMHQVLTLEQGQTFYEMGTLEGYYPDYYYTAATPIVLDNNYFAVFVSGSAEDFETSRRDITGLFVTAIIAVFIIAIIITYLMTYNLVKPLRQMAYAAHRFGEGDFSYRVTVKGHDEMASLANAFNKMALSLSSSESMRRSFVANVSHELKTPMTVIAGYIDGILDGTIPPEKHKFYLNTVSDEVKRLSRLVRTMLDLSKLEAGEMKISPARFDLNESILRILISFEQRIEEKDINILGLENNLPAFIEADPDMLYQVIYNLMDNAIKFVDKSGHIEIKVWEDGGRAYCAIKNSGMGIATNELPHIFDRFYKTDKSRSLDKKGVGLGLYLVNMFISLHGGKINVSSVEGEYTCFEFYVPVSFNSKDDKKISDTRAHSGK